MLAVTIGTNTTTFIPVGKRSIEDDPSFYLLDMVRLYKYIDGEACQVNKSGAQNGNHSPLRRGGGHSSWHSTKRNV